MENMQRGAGGARQGSLSSNEEPANQDESAQTRGWSHSRGVKLLASQSLRGGHLSGSTHPKQGGGACVRPLFHPRAVLLTNLVAEETLRRLVLIGWDSE